MFAIFCSKNQAINFLQKRETTYDSLVIIDRHLVSVIPVKLKRGVRTTEKANRILGKDQ